MKKQLLIAFLGFMSEVSNAQTIGEEPVYKSDHNYFSTIPACCCKDAKPYLVVTTYKEVYDDVYDRDYEAVESLICDEKFGLVKRIPVAKNLLSLISSDLEKGRYIGEFIVSQTLFNDDAAFEYIDCDEVEIPNGYDWPKYYSTYMRVMSDNGKELARLTFDKPLNSLLGSTLELIHSGDKTYLYIRSYYFDSEDRFEKLYQINKSSDGQDAIQEVTISEGLKAFPALAEKNQSVNIELGSNAGGRLLVTSVNGSVVRQLPVEQGQTSVLLDTRGLSSGIYVVFTVNANGKQESCKIIIK